MEGEQRNRGVELNAHGAAGNSLHLYVGLTWIDAKLTKTGNPATSGAPRSLLLSATADF